MRHLKKFEELNIETYINAGDNLKKVGHLERGQKLIDWAKKGKLGDVGEFNIWIKWMTSYPATATSRKGITSGIISDTPIKAKLNKIELNLDLLKDDIEYHKSTNILPVSITISFEINESELSKIKPEYIDLFKDECELSSYKFWPMELHTHFNLNENGNIDRVSPITIFTYGELGTMFSDRKSANNFRNILRKVLTNEIKVYTGYKNEDDDKYMTNSEAMFEILPNIISTIEISDVEMILDEFKNINTNKLYNEDPKEAFKRISH